MFSGACGSTVFPHFGNECRQENQLDACRVDRRREGR